MSERTYSAKILADSVSPSRQRLTTFEISLPRSVLAELNTHKMLAKNSESSRARPIEKVMQNVRESPYIPVWGLNQPGMQARKQADSELARKCTGAWLKARDAALAHVEILKSFGIHKQDTNRLLEPFMWHTALITGTDWWNFFHLRNNENAHPAIRNTASLMQDLYVSNKPWRLNHGEWHMPLLPDRAELNGVPLEDLVKISVGRCARVSYLTHDGARDTKKDIALFKKLLTDGHLSPFEHVARPMTARELDFFRRPVLRFSNDYRWTDPNAEFPWEITDDNRYYFGNLNGWVQLRKMIPHEDDILGVRD